MPKRLVFLFYSHGSAKPDNIPDYSLKLPSLNKFAVQFETDGLFYVFRRLIELGAVEEVLIVTESARDCGTVDRVHPKIRNIVIPHITCLEDELRDDDIIFTRGGFRSWHDWLVDKQQLGYWMWLYAANTGRQRWPWWDLIMDDLNKEVWNTTDRHGRHYLDYRKPVNPEVFFPCDGKPEYKYDIMIGASNITDKKGQWRVINALDTFRSMYGYFPRCVIPGAERRNAETSKSMSMMRKSGMEVDMPGMLDRNELAGLMRQTRVFIHGGAAGQNDRGPLEAMACGCFLIINAPSYHHPLITAHGAESFVLDCNDKIRLAQVIANIMEVETNDQREASRQQAIEYFDRTHGVERVVVPDFLKILKFFDKYPKRSAEAKEAIKHELA